MVSSPVVLSRGHLGLVRPTPNRALTPRPRWNLTLAGTTALPQQPQPRTNSPQPPSIFPVVKFLFREKKKPYCYSKSLLYYIIYRFLVRKDHVCVWAQVAALWTALRELAISIQAE